TYKDGQQRLYLDGVHNNPERSNNWRGTLTYTADPIWIGRSGATSFDGLIDEVAIFNRTLSETEIANYYAKGVITQAQGKSFAWTPLPARAQSQPAATGLSFTKIDSGRLNATVDDLSSWTNNEIVVELPGVPEKGIYVSEGNAQVAVVTPDNVSNEASFHTPPKIISLEPDHGPVGSWVTITGQGFGRKGDKSFVRFCSEVNNGSCVGSWLEAAPLPATCGETWSDTTIITKVPVGAVTYFVQVENEGEQVVTNKNSKTFNVRAEEPLAPGLCNIKSYPLGQQGSSYSKQAYPGDPIALFGEGFGGQPEATDHVEITNKQYQGSELGQQNVSWSDGQIGAGESLAAGSEVIKPIPFTPFSGGNGVGLFVFNGKLYTSAGGKIYRFNGNQFVSIGVVPGGRPYFATTVVYQNKLYGATDINPGKVYVLEKQNNDTEDWAVGDWKEFKSFSNVVFKLLVYNGLLHAQVSDYGIYRYDGNNQWTSIGTAYPQDNSRYTMLTFGGKLYAECVDRAKYNYWDLRLCRYDGAKIWTYVGRPEERRPTGYAALGDTLYVGGGSSVPTDKANVYRYEGPDKWTPVGRLGQDTYAHQLVVFNNKLYGVGYPSGYLYRYDGGEKWAAIGRLSMYVADPLWGTAVYNDKLYVLNAYRGRALEIGKTTGRVFSEIFLQVPTPKSNSSLVTSDFNKDGKMDIATNAGVSLGNGDGTFQIMIPFEQTLSAVIAGDFTGDRKADVIGILTSNRTIMYLLEGNGDGTFKVGRQITGGEGLPDELPYPRSPLSGDFDRDGKLDFLVANHSGSTNFHQTTLDNYFKVFMNNGDGTFRQLDKQQLPARADVYLQAYYQGTLGDFDRDGILDVAFVPWAQFSPVAVYFGNGDGTFREQESSRIQNSGGRGSIASGDVNNDGKTDLVVLAADDKRTVATYLGNGDGSFQTKPISIATGAAGTNGALEHTLVLADYNGDGKLDLSAVGGGTLKVYLGNGDGTFKRDDIPYPVIPGGGFDFHNPMGIMQGAAVDVNNDGRLDYLGTMYMDVVGYINASSSAGQLKVADDAVSGLVRVVKDKPVLTGKVSCPEGSIIVGNMCYDNINPATAPIPETQPKLITSNPLPLTVLNIRDQLMVSGQQPEPGADNVCRNSIVQFSIGGKYCPANTTELADGNCQDSDGKIVVKELVDPLSINDGTVRLAAVRDSCGAGEEEWSGVEAPAGSKYCLQLGARAKLLDDNRTVKISLGSLVLEPTTKYAVAVDGRNNGPRGVDGAILPQTMVWTFTTGQNVCRIGQIDMEVFLNNVPQPDSVVFSKFSDVATVRAVAYDDQGRPLEANYNWLLDPGASAVSVIDGANNSQTVTVKPKNQTDGLGSETFGSGLLAVVAKPNSNQVDPTVATVPIAAKFCELPWSLDDSKFNFKLSYCRGQKESPSRLPSLVNDTQQEGEFTETTSGIIRKDSASTKPNQAELLREYLLPVVGQSSDVLGIRVFSNPEQLPLANWYQKYAPNPGNPRSLTVGGFPALQDGRSTYVFAFNLTKTGGSATPGESGGKVQSYWWKEFIGWMKDLLANKFAQAATLPKLYTNVYLISYNDGATAETQQVYKALLANWRFLSNHEDSSGVLLRSLQRDFQRYVDLRSIANGLESYQRTHNGFYPALTSGTYVKNNTNSRWPSWQKTLGKELNISLPVDPQNTFGDTVSSKLTPTVKIATNWCDQDDTVTFTEEGRAWGLNETWQSERPVAASTTTKVLARRSDGQAAAWLYTPNPRYRNSGYLRLYDQKDSQPPTADHFYDICSTSLYDLSGRADCDATDLVSAKPNRLVYYDPNFRMTDYDDWTGSYVSNYSVGNGQNNLVKYLENKGFTKTSAYDLAAFMADDSNGAGTVVVLPMTAPYTIVGTLDPQSLVRKYMERGGRVVSLGDAPFAYTVYPDRTEKNWSGGRVEDRGNVSLQQDNLKILPAFAACGTVDFKGYNVFALEDSGPCPGSDPQTCWDQSKLKFTCPVGSRVYSYKFKNLSYNLSAQFDNPGIDFGFSGDLRVAQYLFECGASAREGYCGDGAYQVGPEQCELDAKNFSRDVCSVLSYDLGGNIDWHDAPKVQTCSRKEGNLCQWSESASAYDPINPLLSCGGYCGDNIVQTEFNEVCDKNAVSASGANYFCFEQAADAPQCNDICSEVECTNGLPTYCGSGSSFFSYSLVNKRTGGTVSGGMITVTDRGGNDSRIAAKYNLTNGTVVQGAADVNFVGCDNNGKNCGGVNGFLPTSLHSLNELCGYGVIGEKQDYTPATDVRGGEDYVLSLELEPETYCGDGIVQTPNVEGVSEVCDPGTGTPGLETAHCLGGQDISSNLTCQPEVCQPVCAVGTPIVCSGAGNGTMNFMVTNIETGTAVNGVQIILTDTVGAVQTSGGVSIPEVPYRAPGDSQCGYQAMVGAAGYQLKTLTNENKINFTSSTGSIEVKMSPTCGIGNGARTIAGDITAKLPDGSTEKVGEATVELKLVDGSVVATTTANSNGRYGFSQVAYTGNCQYQVTASKTGYAATNSGLFSVSKVLTVKHIQLQALCGNGAVDTGEICDPANNETRGVSCPLEHGSGIRPCRPYGDALACQGFLETCEATKCDNQSVLFNKQCVPYNQSNDGSNTVAGTPFGDCHEEGNGSYCFSTPGNWQYQFTLPFIPTNEGGGYVSLETPKETLWQKAIGLFSGRKATPTSAVVTKNSKPYVRITTKNYNDDLSGWTDTNWNGMLKFDVSLIEPTSGGEEDKVEDKVTGWWKSLVARVFGPRAVTPTAALVGPPVVSLTAGKETIVEGERVDLSWTASGATTGSITPTVGSIPVINGSGIETVCPIASATYTLSATNASKQTSQATAAVTIGGTSSGPAVTLDVSKTEITVGESVTLSWTTDRVASASLTDIGSLDTSRCDGSFIVTPSAVGQHTYTITGMDSLKRNVTVSVIITASLTATGPKITSLSVSPLGVPVGGTATVFWTTEDATKVVLKDLITGEQWTSLPMSGSKDVQPTANTTYRLIVDDGIDSVVRDITVSVTPPPVITSFTASPSASGIGKPVMLFWTTDNASTSVRIDPGVGEVSPKSGGLVIVNPTIATEYTLTAVGPSGTTTETVAVTMTGAPTATFEAQPSFITPGSSSNLVWTAGNYPESASIDPTVGNVSPASGGSATVTPASTTTYTLTVHGLDGVVEKTATVMVGNKRLLGTYQVPAKSHTWTVPLGDLPKTGTYGLLLEWKNDYYCPNSNPKCGGVTRDANAMIEKVEFVLGESYAPTDSCNDGTIGSSEICDQNYSYCTNSYTMVGRRLCANSCAAYGTTCEALVCYEPGSLSNNQCVMPKSRILGKDYVSGFLNDTELKAQDVDGWMAKYDGVSSTNYGKSVFDITADKMMAGKNALVLKGNNTTPGNSAIGVIGTFYSPVVNSSLKTGVGNGWKCKNIAPDVANKTWKEREYDDSLWSTAVLSGGEYYQSPGNRCGNGWPTHIGESGATWITDTANTYCYAGADTYCRYSWNCGDGTVQWPEKCDDESRNGNNGCCNTTCTQDTQGSCSGVE
ncbi:MAG: FG-GAP-like repeat-containing protein, partial [bacterium]